MRLVLTLLVFVATLVVTVYAHRQLFRQPSPLPLRLLGHGLVLVVAGAFGWAVAAVYMGAEEGGGLAAFVTAFGIAHLPPAIVLFLKEQEKS